MGNVGDSKRGKKLNNHVWDRFKWSTDAWSLDARRSKVRLFNIQGSEH